MQATGHEVIRCVHKVDANSNRMECCDMCAVLYSKLLSTIVSFLGAISVGDALFGEGSGAVFEYIDCAGTELNVTQCIRGSVGQLNCHHGRDVGVICQGINKTVQNSWKMHTIKSKL